MPPPPVVQVQEGVALVDGDVPTTMGVRGGDRSMTMVDPPDADQLPASSRS